MSYTKPIDNFILQLKFSEKLIYAKILGYLIAQHIQKSKNSCQAILPVPLHKKRLKKRGYNQALELAKIVSKKTQLPLLKDHLIRHIPTEAQATLQAKNRKNNLQDAFSLKKPINYSSVALVDDVMTTKSTAENCALVLKKKGIKHIEIWCAARSCNSSVK